ncbi:Establishment of cohesion 1 [Coelomomyces lativittatus]|nr:Establishment of cohesion 1 [Coelomomyces lativittatus]KAJ1514788.1 Establishment of cohesion 1 [Coelomomyces lativittatus]
MNLAKGSLSKKRPHATTTVENESNPSSISNSSIIQSCSFSSQPNASQKSLYSYFYKKPKKKALSEKSIVEFPTDGALPNPLISQPKQPVLSQLTLNFGQKGQTPIHCQECGMHYFPFSKEDKNVHQKYHDAFTKVPYQTLKNEKILLQMDTYKIVCIDQTASPSAQERAKSICEFVHRQLNAVPMEWSSHTQGLLLYVTRQYVTGILLVQFQVSQVFLCSNPNEYHPEQKIILPTPILGVERIWVAKSRQGIGTLLVRLAQKEFQSELIAFSQPTEAGWKFAKALMKDSPIYIYL